MKIIDILEETYSALVANKVRTGLTMLGIIIGIASVIAMISIGQGAQSSITSSIQSIGSNLLMVTPGAQRTPGVQVSTGRGSAKTLTAEDANAISSLTGVKDVAPELSSRYQVTAKGTNTNTSVDGVTASYLAVKNLEIDLGNFITEQNNRNISKVAVLGPTVRDDLFGEGANPIGQTIRVNGIQFNIIGVTAAKGGTGFGSQDDMIFIPLNTAQRFLAGSDYVSTINIQAESTEIMTEVQTEVTDLLLTRHKITDSTLADFSIMNQSDIVATASSVTDTFTTLLAAVAGISLIVGGIGIMNMMLTTVTERTREIGLRKAIGAKSRDINSQFLIEAVSMTFIGGLIGVILGWFIGYLLSILNIIQTDMSLVSVLLAFGVSAGIGIIFGYYPARRASKLNPIEALRYE
ncbi:MAG: ABC transporter permease [Candidatus Paceibacterota bacterium]